MSGPLSAPPPRGLDLRTVEHLLERIPLLDSLDRIDDVTQLLAGSATGLGGELTETLSRLRQPFDGAQLGGYNTLRAVRDFAPRFRREARRILADGNTLLGHIERAANSIDAAGEYRRILTFGAEGFLRDLDRHRDDRVVGSVARRYIRDILLPEFGSTISLEALEKPRPRWTPNSLWRLSHFGFWRISIERSIDTPQYEVGGCLIPLTETGAVSEAEHQKFLREARDEVAATESDAGTPENEIHTRPLHELRTPTGHDLVLEVAALLHQLQPAALEHYRRIALERPGASTPPQ